MPAFNIILLTNLHATLAKRSALHVLPHLTYLINLCIRICGSGRGFLECDLQSSHPFLERRNRVEQLAVGRARPPPSSRQLSHQGRPPLSKGWGLSTSGPGPVGWEGVWFFPGHWHTLSILATCPCSIPVPSSLEGPRDIPILPLPSQTPREEGRGRNCLASRTQLCLGPFSTPSIQIHSVEET